MTKIFPIILIVLMALSGILCLYEGDWKKGGYWLSAALLNLFIIL